MRVVKLKTLQEFWGTHTDAKGALETWYRTVKKEQWTCFNDVKKRFGTADLIQGNRAVFNIKGNHYRIVVKIHYNTKIVFIRFIGTHTEYDRINVETI
jgi:mRNA interferase HigB